MKKLIFTIKDIILILIGIICFIGTLAMIGEDNFGIAFFGILSFICFYFSRKTIKFFIKFTIKALDEETKRQRNSDSKKKFKKEKIIINSYSTTNPYANAVPHDVYKDVYTNNKSNSYPNSYIVFDTETTGLEPEIDKIIEISAIKYINGQEVDKFSQLVNPMQTLDPYITKLTGIRNIDLITKPTIKTVLPRFFEFIEDYTLVAHNTQYDIKMIACECYRNNINMCNNKLIDTVALAKKMIPKDSIKDYKLTTLKEYFGINIRSHRALDDCIMCNIVYQNYLKFNEVKSVKKRIVIMDENTGEIIE